MNLLWYFFVCPTWFLLLLCHRAFIILCLHLFRSLLLLLGVLLVIIGGAVVFFHLFQNGLWDFFFGAMRFFLDGLIFRLRTLSFLMILICRFLVLVLICTFNIGIVFFTRIVHCRNRLIFFHHDIVLRGFDFVLIMVRVDHVYLFVVVVSLVLTVVGVVTIVRRRRLDLSVDLQVSRLLGVIGLVDWLGVLWTGDSLLALWDLVLLLGLAIGLLLVGLLVISRHRVHLHVNSRQSSDKETN